MSSMVDSRMASRSRARARSGSAVRTGRLNASLRVLDLHVTRLSSHHGGLDLGAAHALLAAETTSLMTVPSQAQTAEELSRIRAEGQRARPDSCHGALIRRAEVRSRDVPRPPHPAPSPPLPPPPRQVSVIVHRPSDARACDRGCGDRSRVLWPRASCSPAPPTAPSGGIAPRPGAWEEARSGRGSWRTPRALGARAASEGRSSTGELVELREGDGALDAVLELADVARATRS